MTLCTFRSPVVAAVGALAVLAACGASDGQPVTSAAPDGGAGVTDSGVHPDSPGSSSDAGGAVRDAAGADDTGAGATGDAAGAHDAGAGDGPDSGLPGWMLVWSDEFNAADGTPADLAKWKNDVGGSGWGNKELEYYTPGATNAVQKGGSLVITTTNVGASQYTCWNGPCQYTSARLLTSSLYSVAYGRIEARVQMPAGSGLWPAFWMLGNNIGTAGWPGCGEIDIMENVGREPGINHGSLHGPGYSGGNPLTATYTLPNGAKLADAFHVFAVEWDPNQVRFFVDGVAYETRTPADVPAGDTWVYDHDFFILLNVAVGGAFPGTPDGTAVFPQEMRVDYVRVYKRV
jgi:beta-glucanase (GH16 family)